MESSQIFIIGAGRSGTNILRDALSSMPGIVTWPCDEINLVFRHGNRTMKHDEFEIEHATPGVKKYIRHAFKKLENQFPENRVLEKTCANSLRVPFLNEIFPEAKFIFIARNGYDVTASAAKRWTSSIELSYLLKKLKFVPKSDIPSYVLRFIKNRWKQMFSEDKRMATWGPIYPGMEADAKSLSLVEVCAKQWARCVVKANDDLNKIESNRVYKLDYESFVSSPKQYISEIGGWLGYTWEDEEIAASVKDVRTGSVGKGLKDIEADKKANLDSIISPVMNSVYKQITSDVSGN